MNRFPTENIDKVNASKSSDQLTTSRNIKLTGDVTGSASFNGTAEASITATVANNSHTHTLSNITDYSAPTTITGNAGSATKLATARTICGMNFDGSSAVINYGSCSTEAATAEKVVAISNFKLVTGSVVFVRFTVTNTVDNPTLNVNSTGAKAIYYRNAAISKGYLAANRVYCFVYDGTQWELVGDINTDTNTKVTQTLTTTDAEYALLAMADAAATANKTNTSRFASAVTLNPSTGTITATKFKGTPLSAITGLSVSGKTITYTKGDGTTGTITTQDTNTTYSQATASALGLVKLYTSTGTSTDGTMTRAAITSALSSTSSYPSVSVAVYNRPSSAWIKSGNMTIVDNNTFTLPSGGTWIYAGNNAGDYNGGSIAGTLSGGSTISHSLSAYDAIFIAIRIS